MPFRKPLLGELLDYSDPLTKGLVGLWLMNEGSGNKVFDLSGNNPSGTIFGTTAWVPGKFGPALDFNKTAGNYVNTNALQSVIDLPISANFSVVFWAAAPDSDADQGAIGFSGADDLVIYPYDTGRIKVFWRDVGAAMMTFNHSLAGTGFHQFAFVSYGLTDHRFFINGVQVKTSSNDASGAGPFSDLFLGTFAPSTQNFHGQIDNVSIYNRGLLPSVIALLYREPFRYVGKRRREGAVAGGVSVGFINAAGQADIVTSSLAGFRRLNRPGAAQADIVTASLAGFRRLNRPGAGQADIVTSSLAGMRWSMGAQADIVTSSLAGMRRLNRPGAAQAAINIQTFAGATGGSAAITLEEIFRYRRFRDAGVFRRRNLKGVY